jgi:hypothetical protein
MSGLLISAAGAAVRTTVPRPVRRLVRHELVLWTSLLRWIARRPPHGVGEGDAAVGYAGGQSVAAYVLLFVSVVETVALAYLIPWRLVHTALLILDLWGVFFILALQASCVVRPHVVGADGSLRVRYGALIDIRVPADRIASVRQDRRFPEGHLLQLREDGTLDLILASQTTVTVELTEPVTFLRPLGKPAQARTLRIYADDPRRAVTALAGAAFGTRPPCAKPIGIRPPSANGGG